MRLILEDDDIGDGIECRRVVDRRDGEVDRRDARVCALVADITLASDGPSSWELPAPSGEGLLTVLPLGDGLFRVPDEPLRTAEGARHVEAVVEVAEILGGLERLLERGGRKPQR